MMFARRVSSLSSRCHLSCGLKPSPGPLSSSKLLVSRSCTSNAYLPLPERLPRGAILRYPHRERAELVGADDKIKSRGLTIAVIGASESGGRQIATSLIRRRRAVAGLVHNMTVQFVGSREDDSLGTLIGLCSEMRDAFDESCPHLEVVVDVEAVQADIIIMSAGAEMSHQHRTFPELARANMDVFDVLAKGLVAKNADSIVFIASHPGEFAVECFVEAGFSRERVLGLGTLYDTLRFRRELASELGISRQQISGLVLGMHGLDMVPCWSTVQLAAHCPPSTRERLEELKEEGLARMPRDIGALRKFAYEIREQAEHHNALPAVALVNCQPPDVRASLRRYISHFIGPMYPRVGKGENVAQLVFDLIEGRDIITAAQVYVQGEFLGVSGQAIGVPVILSSRGVKVVSVELTPKEEEAFLASAAKGKNLTQKVKELKVMSSKTLTMAEKVKLLENMVLR